MLTSRHCADKQLPIAALSHSDSIDQNGCRHAHAMSVDPLAASSEFPRKDWADMASDQRIYCVAL